MAQRMLLEEALRLIDEAQHQLAEVEKLHDDKYLSTNAAARAHHALVQAGVVLRELRDYHIGGR